MVFLTVERLAKIMAALARACVASMRMRTSVALTFRDAKALERIVVLAGCGAPNSKAVRDCGVVKQKLEEDGGLGALFCPESEAVIVLVCRDSSFGLPLSSNETG